MTVNEFIWLQDRIEHIGKHGVEPHELEEVCFGQALVQRTKASGPNPVYYVLGQTLSGRPLFCVVIQFPDRKGYPVTARPMSPREKKRYNKWKRP